MSMPNNDLVTLLSLEQLRNHFHCVTSSNATTKTAIVTCTFEVTICNPLFPVSLAEVYAQRSHSRYSSRLDLHCRSQPQELAAPQRLKQTFFGSMSFDGTQLTGVGMEFLPVVRIEFNFLGNRYASGNSAVDFQPKVVFCNGNFLGLSFLTEDFSFVEGLFGREEAYFIYDLERGSGAGDVNYYLNAPASSTASYLS